MSKENLEQFMSKVADSEELQAKIGEEIDAAALIALGAESGCEFTADDLTEYAKLSDDELDEVAGGWSTKSCTAGGITSAGKFFDPFFQRYLRSTGDDSVGQGRGDIYKGKKNTGGNI